MNEIYFENIAAARNWSVRRDRWSSLPGILLRTRDYLRRAEGAESSAPLVAGGVSVSRSVVVFVDFPMVDGVCSEEPWWFSGHLSCFRHFSSPFLPSIEFAVHMKAPRVFGFFRRCRPSSCDDINRYFWSFLIFLLACRLPRSQLAESERRKRIREAGRTVVRSGTPGA